MATDAPDIFALLELLVRAVPYHNHVENTRRLAKLPGITDIQPPQLEADALATETPKRKPTTKRTRKQSSSRLIHARALADPRTMSREKLPRPTRAQLLILVKQHLERAGEHGLSFAELLAAFAPMGVTRRTLERALADLRSKHDADIEIFGKPKRLRLGSAVPLPLDAPHPKDIIALHHAIALAKPLLPRDLGDRLTTIAESLDERVRNYAAATDLPHSSALTSSFTRSMKADEVVVDRLLLACRRQTVRIRYASPWQDPRAPAWQEVEPWALDIRDAAYYLRAWAVSSKHAHTFTVAHISGVEITDATRPRHPIPAKPWEQERKGFGIDTDRPGVAVIRLRGGVARWVFGMIWHPDQHDDWPLPGELLVRTLRYNSCRELARLLVTVIDGIVSIEPAELKDEVIKLCAHARTLA